ncbi:hypothetical protein Syun_025433 [Stephania yunnanensis]|uniref:Uncharacterized protein n=1 Tax=Stephania yunnanensis TaxID=152371 RepID=A0AAP0EX78_9MAGN
MWKVVQFHSNKGLATPEHMVINAIDMVKATRKGQGLLVHMMMTQDLTASLPVNIHPQIQQLLDDYNDVVDEPRASTTQKA